MGSHNRGKQAPLNKISRVQLRPLPELHFFENARNSEGRLNTIDPVLNPRGSDLMSKNLNDLAGRLACKKSRLGRMLELKIHRFPEISNCWLTKFIKNLTRSIGIHLDRANLLSRNLQLQLAAIPSQDTAIGLGRVEYKQEKRALSSDFREDDKAAGVNAIRHNRDPNNK